MCKYDNRLYVCDHSAPRDGVSIVLLLMHEDIAGRQLSAATAVVTVSLCGYNLISILDYAVDILQH